MELTEVFPVPFTLKILNYDELSPIIVLIDRFRVNFLRDLVKIEMNQFSLAPGGGSARKFQIL